MKSLVLSLLTPYNFFFMAPLKYFFLALFIFAPACLSAQKPFTEGTIIYRINMGPEDQNIKPGTYSIIIKGEMIRKEMKMANLDYTVIINCRNSKVYSLRSRNGKKYAIELKMDDLLREQEKFRGYTLLAIKNEIKKIAGYQASWSTVTYKDGSECTIAYSSEWKPAMPVTYERFPDACFLPLNFIYKNEAGNSVTFEAEKIDPGPIENAVFRIPPDYKIISNAEYMEMNR